MLFRCGKLMAINFSTFSLNCGPPCCPRHLLYLETGFVPARFQIQRQMLNLLHYILQQPQGSLLYRMFEVQRKYPTQGDWTSEVSKLIISHKLSIHEIKKNMKESQFKNITKKKAKLAAFQYLLDKLQNRKKGNKIIYTKLQFVRGRLN